MGKIGNPNIANIGKETRFSKTNPPKNSGRKPSKLRRHLKDNNLNDLDITFIMKNLITKTRDELLVIAKSDKESMIMAGAAAAMLKDMGKGNTSTLQWVIDRGFGKPKESVKVDATIKDEVASMSDEERKATLDKLMLKRVSAMSESDKVILLEKLKGEEK